MDLLERMKAWLAESKEAMVSFELGDGQKTALMDRATVGWMIAMHEQGAPRQAALDALADKVDRARVFDGGCDTKPHGTRAMLDVSGDDARALFARLRIREDDKLSHCMCTGSQAIELWAGGSVVAVIALHHATSIRWSGTWAGDGRLADPDELCTWLAARGVTGPLRERESSAQHAREREGADERWMKAAPPCLADRRDLLLPEDDEPHVDELREVLARGIPDPVERARALFTLYGAGSPPSHGLTMGADAVRSLLLGYDTAVLEAAASSDLDERGLRGAAWVFSDSVFVGARYEETLARPAALKAKLRGADPELQAAELFFGDGLAAIIRSAPDVVRPELPAIFASTAREHSTIAERIVARSTDPAALARALLDFARVAKPVAALVRVSHAVLERLPDATVAAAAERSPEAFSAFAFYLQRSRSIRDRGLAIPDDLRARLIARVDDTFEQSPMRAFVKGLLEKAP